ncbi:MAG: hypothetical protein IT366_22680 [Candidatus Hydrogenedentes bacterium]|nr:hypothetical protein [Candidatus Hydrogenedentota bacterium]
MFTADKMDRVTAAVLRKDVDIALDEIVRRGVLHPSHVSAIDDWTSSLSETGARALASEYEKRKLQLQRLVENTTDTSTAASPEAVKCDDLRVIDDTIAEFEAQIAPQRASLSALRTQRAELSQRLEQIASLFTPNLPLPELLRSAFLYSAIGKIDLSRLPELQAAATEMPCVIAPLQSNAAYTHVLCVTLRRDADQLKEILRACGFQEASLPADIEILSAEVHSKTSAELAALDIAMAEAANALDSARAVILPGARTLICHIDETLVLLQMKGTCRQSESSCVFSGWVPRANSSELLKALRDKTDGRALVERVDAELIEDVYGEEIGVPVRFTASRYLAPFNMLVDTYGVPAYRMLNPTAFVALSFLFMFGMMFGDVGHGAVLAALGVYLLKHPRYAATGKIALACSAVSIIFGLLYGSIFGIETIIPALWTPPLESPSALFAIAIGFGVTLISIGFALNIINSLRRRSLLKELFDVSGPLTAIAYWGGIGLAIKGIAFEESALPPMLAILAIATPLTLFFVKGPVLAWTGHQKRAFPDGVVSYIMECVVKILEVLMGCVANTVSFIRVAAFGLAHAGLFVAIFSIADALPSGAAGAVGSWIVFVLGNAIVIALEGVVVTIQALRLEYYEFFGKFFSRSGTKYQPISFSKAVPH